MLSNKNVEQSERKLNIRGAASIKPVWRKVKIERSIKTVGIFFSNSGSTKTKLLFSLPISNFRNLKTNDYTIAHIIASL